MLRILRVSPDNALQIAEEASDLSDAFRPVVVKIIFRSVEFHGRDRQIFRQFFPYPVCSGGRTLQP